MLFIIEVLAGFVLRVDLAQIGIVPVNCSPELNYNAPPVCGNSICPLYYVNRRGNGDDKNDDGDESMPLTSLRGNRRQQAIGTIDQRASSSGAPRLIVMQLSDWQQTGSVAMTRCNERGEFSRNPQSGSCRDADHQRFIGA